MAARIVALLLSLADLAELAGSKSPAFRTMLLLILRPAEAATRRYVLEACGYAPDTPLPHLEDGDDSTAAIRLALSFRTLAAMLANLPEGEFEEWAPEAWDHIASLPGLRDLHDVVRRLPARHAPERLDSS